jgi:hypothetical protein
MSTQQNVAIGNVYPWGRSLDEYQRMFALSADDLAAKIIGCGDGPASFNCELTRRGGRVISCDPLYQFSVEQIHSRIEQTRDLLIDNARRNAHLFVWDRIGSPEELLRLRMRAMGEFLADYPAGQAAGRYLDRSLPRLDFPDESFDLALCSHFLFLYSDDLSFDFHMAAIMEMCRVAGDVRIFPLLDMKAQTSVHLPRVLEKLGELGLLARIQTVEYEFQRGGNEMLRIEMRREQT